MIPPFDVCIPPSDSVVTVKAINVGTDATLSPASFFLQPVLNGFEGAYGPIYAFLIEHPLKGRVMFDLGIRKDQENLSPAVQGLLEIWNSMGPYSLVVDGDVAQRLTAGGVDLESIKAVIWSHSHLDHTGDMATFPTTTELLVGQGTDLRTYPEFPDATLVESDLAGRKVTEISFEDSKLRIADLAAVDYFGDGSFYILDTPGHHPGHISGLARVTSTTFILLGGDCCHHPGQLRPTATLHARCPCPGHVIDSTKSSVCPKQFSSSSDEEFDLLSRTSPMLSVPSGVSVYADPETAITTIEKLLKLDAHPDVLFLIAHDSSVPGKIDEFPKSLNGWKDKGWKQELTWSFLKEESRAFRFGTVKV
ncbi:beta-lactamase-like protein [Armillaria luteobubalina]|uniref:Beta-lactamase-like protein n=1 Tax=Armillaria luteobubalina TaxID=153913 RepID=A0AA39URU0_9AGAR|nr:beta-lactamase-like protein [Armillaria luteobubalina]